MQLRSEEGAGVRPNYRMLLTLLINNHKLKNWL